MKLQLLTDDGRLIREWDPEDVLASPRGREHFCTEIAGAVAWSHVGSPAPLPDRRRPSGRPKGPSMSRVTSFPLRVVGRSCDQCGAFAQPGEVMDHTGACMTRFRRPHIEPTFQDVPEYVEFRGETWLVADGRWDESGLEGGAGSHWHLTLTAVSREAAGEAAKRDQV